MLALWSFERKPASVLVPRAYLGVPEKSANASVETSKDLLQPVTVEMSMIRNLSAAYYFDKPGIELDGKMNTVCVSNHCC